MPKGSAQIPFPMLIVFGSAKLLSEIFERLGQPGIVGEILIAPPLLKLAFRGVPHEGGRATIASL